MSARASPLRRPCQTRRTAIGFGLGVRGLTTTRRLPKRVSRTAAVTPQNYTENRCKISIREPQKPSVRISLARHTGIIWLWYGRCLLVNLWLRTNVSGATTHLITPLRRSAEPWKPGVGVGRARGTRGAGYDISIEFFAARSKNLALTLSRPACFTAAPEANSRGAAARQVHHVGGTPTDARLTVGA